MTEIASIDYFTETRSEEVVNARMGSDVDPRLARIMASLVKHLHAFAKDVELTQSEWATAIDFLTRTGQMCDGNRQEFILLSDVLGFSMLVDAINHRRPSGATENTVLGPFHVDGAPVHPMGTNICLDGKGESCVFEGRVVDTDGKPIEGQRSTSGPTMRKASTTSSSRTSSRAGTIAASSSRARTAPTASAASGRSPIRSPTTGRSGRC